MEEGICSTSLAPGWELVLEIRRKRYGNVGVLDALEGAENAIEAVKHWYG